MHDISESADISPPNLEYGSIPLSAQLAEVEGPDVSILDGVLSPASCSKPASAMLVEGRAELRGFVPEVMLELAPSLEYESTVSEEFVLACISFQ